MQKPNKPSSLDKLEIAAAKLGDAAKKALDKANAAKKDAAAKVALYETAAKALLKEAKSIAKGNVTAPAKKVSAKKAAVSPTVSVAPATKKTRATRKTKTVATGAPAATSAIPVVKRAYKKAPAKNMTTPAVATDGTSPTVTSA